MPHELTDTHSDAFSVDDTEVHLYRIDLAADDDRLAAMRAVLNADELARAGRFLHAEHARRFSIARGALRVILGSYLNRAAAEIVFSHNAHGKPEVVAAGEPPLRFNVSHTGDLALIAVTRLPTIGVDIERHRKEERLSELAQRYFAPAEVAAWEALPPELLVQGFFHIWTQKEAYVKAHGRGLTYPLNLFVVESDPRSPARLHATLDDPTEAAKWRMETPACPEGYAASLTGPAGAWRLRERDFATLGDTA